MTKKLVKTLLVALCIALFASNTAFASQSPQENAKKLIVQTAQKLGVDPHIALSIAITSKILAFTVIIPSDCEKNNRPGIFMLSFYTYMLKRK